MGGTGGGEVTVTVKLRLAAPPSPSVTVRVRLALPAWPGAAVMVTVRFPSLPPKTMFAVGIRPGFDELAVTPRLPAAVSRSAITNAPDTGMVPPVARSDRVEISGTSFTAFTVSTNELLTASPEVSRTVTVMVVEPDRLVAGVSVSRRLEPEPPSAMPVPGTSDGSEELAVTRRFPAAVSTSLTVNGIAPVGVSSLVTWPLMVETTGASFTALTVRTKLAALLPSAPSLTVNIIVAEPD